LIKIPKRRLFSNLKFALFFLSIFFILPLIYSLETGGNKLRVLFLYPYLLLILSLIFFKFRSDKKIKAIDLACDTLSESVNTTQEVIRNKRILVESLSAKLKRYNQLKDLTGKLTTALSLDESARVILEHVTGLIPQFTSCILYLVNPKTYELNCFLSKSKQGFTIKTKKGDIFDHWVLKKMQALLVEDISKDFRFDVEKIDKEQLRDVQCLIAAPLLTYNKIIGTLRLDSSVSNCFSQEDLRLLVTISDLAAQAIENAILYKHTLDLAIKDGLTSLYLKGYFLERLEEELRRASLNKADLSLLMLDIDKFKDFNDRFGHIAGDIVLKAVSKQLLDFAGKEGNICCRFGGEEFIVLLIDTNKQKAVRLAEDLRQKIKAKEILLRRKAATISVSVGVISCPEDGFVSQDLMLKLDALLYKAKRSGRDKVCFLEK